MSLSLRISVFIMSAFEDAGRAKALSKMTKFGYFRLICGYLLPGWGGD
jgi:hypothetical protein